MSIVKLKAPGIEEEELKIESLQKSNQNLIPKKIRRNDEKTRDGE